MEGYWLAHYKTGERQGDGIVMLHEGELLGGDLEHLWTGAYEEEGPKLSALIRVVPVMSSPEEEIMAREQPMILSLTGYCNDEYAWLKGGAEHQRDLHFEITMSKCKGALAAKQSLKKAA